MVRNIIDKHNKSIDDYINIELANVFGTEISLNDWFKAQKMIKDQCFYEKGMEILKELRSSGYDVKMDMQSNKLVLNEYYEICIDKIDDVGGITDTKIQLSKLSKDEAYEKFELIKKVGYLRKGYAMHINYFDGSDWNEIDEYLECNKI